QHGDNETHRNHRDTGTRTNKHGKLLCPHSKTDAMRSENSVFAQEANPKNRSRAANGALLCYVVAAMFKLNFSRP
ncbi:MAG TPA: hypothetical protein VI386_13320, partial [Candidatus Sulfotelmatobacter sp.]